jgi:hypothetical protein
MSGPPEEEQASPEHPLIQSKKKGGHEARLSVTSATVLMDQVELLDIQLSTGPIHTKRQEWRRTSHPLRCC